MYETSVDKSGCLFGPIRVGEIVGESIVSLMLCNVLNLDFWWTLKFKWLSIPCYSSIGVRDSRYLVITALCDHWFFL